ncbi:MAG: GxxExxY protein [Candidatus Tenebribacter burtonii]|jgi:GxxExxY protein|nr:GxxExxY protein [Candidatus Tenebribacter burtonii]
MEREKLEKIGKQIVDSAYHVHKELGPGLLESAYERCIVVELIDRGLKVERQVKLPIVYKEKILENGYRLDLLVENEIIIELKTVDYILPVHVAQLISYLKLSGKQLGYLINFKVDLIKNGIQRKVNNL